MMALKQLLFDFAAVFRATEPVTRPQNPDCPPVRPKVEPPKKPTQPSSTASTGQPSSQLLTGFDEVRTAQARGWSNAVECPGLASKVSVLWNKRLRTTAGLAKTCTLEIELNPKLVPLGEDVVERTLKHELAHLVAHWRARGRRIAAHGREWKLACEELGIGGEKSHHTLPFEVRRQRRKHGYRCPHCGNIVLRVRPLARGSACWACCKRYAKGQYSERFRFLKVPLDEALRLAKDSEPE